ncbi:glycoside hydrolase 43 family protein [Paraflavitalea sp. CAU 1676]|uniref:glycoside hydrolase family 43 protein n=1 Tax=Paraflavitalea sp. CAU 1676 TaxID=3032598 RepID=UPI0023DC00B2|nr:glycoside hydrolase 43 family protein [Paraflavitalea sp. CAU 1676]MDF2189563.1 glycoside hydrolase 43 family protein [Paraflavitalea sp. CAU 1676]
MRFPVATLAIACILSLSQAAIAQNVTPVSQVWVPDNGNGTYKNPVIDADYSDPDATRVGDDYYLIASSFDAVPGLPILHSKDLVNWSIIGHALHRQPPFDHFAKTQHGNGVWAPAIRHHNGTFYIYYPDPDFGIYVTKATNIRGPWTDPVLVEAGKGLIDPCPLWDDDGKVYLTHAYAGSRAGIKSVIVVKEMNAAGDKVTSTGVLVYDGHATDPTIEGPKAYKRNGYYYLFAPAGGVATGWQLVLRSKHIYGPYERKVVMDQGSTSINGPHQGAWVQTPTGEDWFLHFQDKEAYGRVVHLQPMKWVNNWPVIGVDKDGDGKGEPVLVYKKPNTGKPQPQSTPAETDEFNGPALGLQWQWQANPKATWSFLDPSRGVLRLFSDKVPDSAKNLWEVPNLLLQKWPGESFAMSTRLTFTPNPKLENERAGLLVMGQSYAALTVKKKKDGIWLVYNTCKEAFKGTAETEKELVKLGDSSVTVTLRVQILPGALCRFGYSVEGKEFTDIETPFKAEPGRWIGAKTGLFCTRPGQINDAGFADFDYFRVTKP